MRRLFPVPVILPFLLPHAVSADESHSLSVQLPSVAIDLSDMALQVQLAFREGMAFAVLLAAAVLIAAYRGLGRPQGRDPETPGERTARRVLAAWSAVGVFGFLGAAVLLHRVCFWMAYGGH